MRSRPRSDWRQAFIDIPKRRHKRIRYLDQTIRIGDYDKPIRQIAVDGLGNEQPTLFLTNDFEETPRNLIAGYAGRNGIEDGLGTSVNFFHLDCLTSEVRLNVDLDASATVLAHGCYRWLASRLRGFENAKPKALYRKFVQTAGIVEIEEDRIVVRFEKRHHIPTLREANLDADCPKIPWLGGRTLAFEYP